MLVIIRSDIKSERDDNVIIKYKTLYASCT